MDGAKAVSVNNVPAGDYTINAAAATALANTPVALQGAYNAKSFNATAAKVTFATKANGTGADTDNLITVGGVGFTVGDAKKYGLAADGEAADNAQAVKKMLNSSEAQKKFAEKGYKVKVSGATDELTIFGAKNP